MKFNGREIAFPAEAKISFFKIFEVLEEMAKDEDKNVAGFASQLLEETKDATVLREGFSDKKLLKKYQTQVNKLTRTLFPDALVSNEIKAVTPPFDFEPFYTSKRFDNIMKAAGKDYKLSVEKFDEDMFYIMGCATILNAYYHFPVDLSKPINFEIPNLEKGVSRYYRIAFNADMMEIIPTEKAVEITYDDYLNLINNFDDLKLWKEKFPENSYIMRGIGIANFMDVTIDQATSMVTSNLLVKTNDTEQRLEQNIRTLFNNKDLTVTFVAIEDSIFYRTHAAARPSLILGDNEQMSCDDTLCDYGYHTLINQHNFLAIPDVEKYHEYAQSYMSQNLVDNNLGSYLIMPLQNNDSNLGFIEIGSPRKNELNSVSPTKLREIMPILSMAVSRFKEETTNRIEAIIQQECTTIHSSVKWRFEEEARKYMQSQQLGQHPKFEDIVFKDVYPLYGQSDIKGSSTKRNDAVKRDLIDQMKAVRKVLKKADKLRQLPAIEELTFRVNSYMKEIEDGLLAGSEHKILGFLRSEIYPVFNYLKRADAKIAKEVEAYSAGLDPDLNMVYKARKNFDESVTKTNERLAAFIDKKQKEAQANYPHYFERYKTDGLEFNMYIGDSISNKETFHPLYLSNLRLWQLITMCEMEQEFHALQKDLATPLEVASLILVYNTPLAIHFRMDEKRFDVEGAYNARYEIVKKRVDKAHIKGTQDRITIPGKIAIIYTSEQDVIEYRKYVRFLQDKDYLTDVVEEYVLEDLQGITGLKALRVEVNYNAKMINDPGITFDQVIEAIGN